MPLDSANFISELDLNNPVGSVDTVSMLDDFIRELKKVLLQSFPNINAQANINSVELNNLKTYLQYTSGAWNMQNQPLTNVAAADNDAAVQPRVANDNRYLRRFNNLADLTDKNAAVGNLFTGLDGSTAGYKTMVQAMVRAVYPPGTIYTNGSNGTNPGTIFGAGTWSPFAPGRVIVGVGRATDSRGEGRNFTNGQFGGEYQHLLTIAEMPSHQHGDPYSENRNSFTPPWGWFENSTNRRGSGETDSDNGLANTSPVGGSQVHNNVQPYVAAFMWIRTA